MTLKKDIALLWLIHGDSLDNCCAAFRDLGAGAEIRLSAIICSRPTGMMYSNRRNSARDRRKTSVDSAP